MRRHTKNRCLLAGLLGTGAAVWFLYHMLYSAADHDIFYTLDQYGLSPSADRWAAIKGDELDVEMENEERLSGEEFDDDMFHHMAPPESQAYAEQQAVEERMMEPPVTQKYKEDSPVVAVDVVDVKVDRKEHKHHRHPRPKVSKEDETTVAVTESTTEALTTTEIPVTPVKARKVTHQHPGHEHAHAHANAPSHVHNADPKAEEHLVEQTVELMQESNIVEEVAEPVEEQPQLPPEPPKETPPDETQEYVHAHGHVTEHAVHRVHGHEDKKSHKGGVHGHHTKEENIPPETEVTPPVESLDDQVEWTPEQLLVSNKTDAETASLLAFGETRHFELLNQTVTESSKLGVSVTPKVVLNETKPTNEELQIQMMQYLPDAPTRKTERVNWEKFFSFIPNGLQSCTELFPNLAHQNPLPQDFQKAFIDFQNTIGVLNIKDNNIAEHLEQFIVYYFLVRAPFVKTVCETGFGAGHSAFLWLQANPDVKVYMFDIGVREYSSPIADFLQSKFPGRLKVIWGDSVNTLPMFRQANKDVTCDIVVIDGGHTFRESFADYFHLRQMVTKNNIVLLDNYPDVSKNYMEILGAVWEGGKRRGEVNEIFHCDYRPHEHGFSVGRFIPYTLTVHEAENINANVNIPPS